MAKLPQGWVECQFSDCIDKISISNKLKQKEYLLEGEYPVIDQGHFFISGYYNERNLLLEIGEPVIIFGDHTRCFKYVDFPFIAGADGIKVLKPKQFFDSKLFYYFCLALKFPNKGYSRHYQYLEKTIMHIPPLKEQRRIVEKIESEFAKIDEGLEHLEQAKEQIKQYRQSVLKSAFEGKLTQQNPGDESAEALLQKINPKAKFNHNDKLPQGWIECQLGVLFNIVNGDRGKNYPAKNKLQTSGIPFVSAINIQNSELFIENLLCLNEQQYDLLRSGKINKGDTLLCIRGSIGKHCIYPLEKGAIASSMVIIRKILPSMDKFLFYYLESFCFKQEVKRYDNGTAQPNLSASDLKRFNYILPPLNEQKQIVEEIEKRFTVADDVEKVVEDNIEKAKQLKQSILKKAFEGRLVPQDPTDEPASILLEKIKQERSK